MKLSDGQATCLVLVVTAVTLALIISIAVIICNVKTWRQQRQDVQDYALPPRTVQYGISLTESRIRELERALRSERVEELERGYRVVRFSGPSVSQVLP